MKITKEYQRISRYKRSVKVKFNELLCCLVKKIHGYMTYTENTTDHANKLLIYLAKGNRVLILQQNLENIVYFV